MVGDEVEEQAQAASAEPLAQAGEGGIAAELCVNRVARDGEARAGDVLLAQIRQRLLELPAPLGVGARDALPRRPGLPDAEEPDPVESHPGEPVELGVRDVIERRPPAETLRQLRQPDPRVDLVERRMGGPAVTGVDSGFPAATQAASISVMAAFLPSSRTCSADVVANRCMMRAMMPVQPVWWLAPMPAPLSPWKYS